MCNEVIFKTADSLSRTSLNAPAQRIIHPKNGAMNKSKLSAIYGPSNMALLG